MIIITALISGLVVGGGVYAWMNTVVEITRKDLNAKINQLEEVKRMQSNNGSQSTREMWGDKKYAFGIEAYVERDDQKNYVVVKKKGQTIIVDEAYFNFDLHSDNVDSVRIFDNLSFLANGTRLAYKANGYETVAYNFFDLDNKKLLFSFLNDSFGTSLMDKYIYTCASQGMYDARSLIYELSSGRLVYNGKELAGYLEDRGCYINNSTGVITMSGSKNKTDFIFTSFNTKDETLTIEKFTNNIGFKNDALGVSFIYPARFGKATVNIENGDTGKTFYGRAQTNKLRFGGITADFSAGRGASYLDNMGYQKEGDKYYVSFLGGKELAPDDIILGEMTTANATALLFAGRNEKWVFFGPGKGSYLAIVNLKDNRQFPAFSIISESGSMIENEFKEIIKSIKIY